MEGFNWSEFLDSLLTLVITTVIPVFAKGLWDIVKGYLHKLETDAAGTAYHQYFGLLDSTVHSVVNSISQTYVDALKLQGEFTPEKQIEMRDLAISRIKTELSDEVVGFIKVFVADIDRFLIDQVESAVRDTKTNISAAVPQDI